MEVGTIAEWASALGTTLAATVALFLGARDDETRRSRLVARRRLHALAKLRLASFERWREGLEDPDYEVVGDAPTLDRECEELYWCITVLGRLRRRKGLAILREIYGARSVRVAELLPGQSPDREARLKTLGPRIDLMVDGEPGPLRRRGARPPLGPDFDRLARRFGELSRL